MEAGFRFLKVWDLKWVAAGWWDAAADDDTHRTLRSAYVTRCYGTSRAGEGLIFNVLCTLKTNS